MPFITLLLFSDLATQVDYDCNNLRYNFSKSVALCTASLYVDHEFNVYMKYELFAKFFLKISLCSFAMVVSITLTGTPKAL